MKEIKLTKKDLILLEKEKRGNFRSHMDFVKLKAEFISGISDKTWEMRQKRFIDSVHTANRRLKIKFA
ncbi:MAG: hypothetical protein ACREBF_00605 [Candidatus Micrarchaeales archaeon]